MTNQNLLPRTRRQPKRGPINPLHRIYVRNDKLIQKEIFKAVAERDISVRISTVCRNIDISLPTFYLHYRSCNEVLNRYEMNLTSEFKQKLPTAQDRTTTFSLLLIFIYHHRRYFKANFRNHNFYMFSKLLQELRPGLAGSSVGDKPYLSYTAALAACIAWWGTHENFSKDAIPDYAKQLAKIRIMKY